MFANVIVDISHSNIDKIFDYRIPENLAVKAGSHVLVPFKTRISEGFVISLSETSDFAHDKIKDIHDILYPYPALTQEQLALAAEIKEKYQTTMAQALRLMVPAQLRGGKVKKTLCRHCYLLMEGEPLKIQRGFLNKKDGSIKYPAQALIIDSLLNAEGSLPISGFSGSAIKSLARKNVIGIKDVEVKFTPNVTDDSTHFLKPHNLNETQLNVLQSMRESNKNHFLLHGVTGSGKTEIYINIIKDCINNGKSAILLVPEISLTPQTHIYLKRRLDVPIAIFHSGLTAQERINEWEKVISGQAKVVLGARSAVFAPVENLGVIILDEEHETSYKSETYPTYHTREIAEKRCEYNNAKLILGSATPSVEVRYAAQTGKYIYLSMPNRVANIEMPKVQVVDMRKELKSGNRSILSGVLKNEIETALSENKQAMLFLNRRGYSTFIMCRACGHIMKCSACDITLTYHKVSGVLNCHYCGRTGVVQKMCPECGKPYLKYFGVGTQQVEEIIKNEFTGVRIMRMDIDTMRTKDAYFNAFKSFSTGEADILIGTQMITKGFDFDSVKVSAVLAADTTLNIPDFRSSEEAFRQMVQFAGRAGRKELGKVIIQTYNPEHYAIQYAKNHDYNGFYQHELKVRKNDQKPPFSKFIKIQFSGETEDEIKYAVKDCIKTLKTVLLPKKNDIIKVSASQSAIKRVNNKFRYHILINLKIGADNLTSEIFKLVSAKKYTGILVGIDENPNTLI